MTAEVTYYLFCVICGKQFAQPYTNVVQPLIECPACRADRSDSSDQG